MNPAAPIGSTAGFSNIDPQTGNPITPPLTNQLENYGWEYVWHCHLLGHEENDMMRPIDFGVSPAAPSGLTGSGTSSVALHWTNNATWPAATSFTVQRATNTSFTAGLTTFNGPGPTSYTDNAVLLNTTYYYRVRAENAVSYSTWSNTVLVSTRASAPNPVTNLHTTAITGNSIAVAWTLPASGGAATSIRVQYSRNAGGPWTTAATLAATATSRNITGLLGSTRYYIRVQTINASGTGTSSVINALTGP
jgi:hypothetical protein